MIDKKDIGVYITAYNRQGMLDALLEQLTDFNVTVFDDASEPKLVVPKSVQLVRARQNHGKKGYCVWINKLVQMARRGPKYTMVLPDDVLFIDGGLDRARAIFADLLLDNPNKGICLNMLRDNRNSNWTKKKNTHYNESCFSSGWVDGLFICNKKFLHNFGSIPSQHPGRWIANPAQSSGAWEYVTRKNYKDGHLFFQVKKSIVVHGDHPSVMHPEHRKKSPIRNKP